MITKTEYLNITTKNEIKINFGNYFNSTNKKDLVLLPVSKPRFSKKYNLHKLTLKNKHNPGGAKFYAYLRDEKVSFAFSDMPIYINSIQIN